MRGGLNRSLQPETNMDVSGLNLSDLRILRNAPAAQKGYPFKDSYLRGIFESTTWYDSLMYDLDARMQPFESKDNESWRDAYMRAIDEQKLVTYNEQETAFMNRLKEREDELKKQNFAVEEGLRVNMTNLLNPTQLKDFDTTLCQKLAEEGFAIVPSNHSQLFHVYEQNDYSDFPSFVTTDLYLQLYHLYIDCMLREVEENKLLPMMIRFCRDMHEMLYNMERWSGFDEKVNAVAHHNAVHGRLHLCTGEGRHRRRGSREGNERRRCSQQFYEGLQGYPFRLQSLPSARTLYTK